jgi:hypothetical protein
LKITEILLQTKILRRKDAINQASLGAKHGKFLLRSSRSGLFSLDRQNHSGSSRISWDQENRSLRLQISCSSAAPALNRKASHTSGM